MRMTIGRKVLLGYLGVVGVAALGTLGTLWALSRVVDITERAGAVGTFPRVQHRHRHPACARVGRVVVVMSGVGMSEERTRCA